MEWFWASIPLSGATWLGGPTCLCGYKWFSMSSCVPWECSGLGGRLTPGPAVTGLLVELQPMVIFLINPPRPGPDTSGECRSPDTAGDCTPAILFTPKPEFPCGGGTKNLALLWLLPMWFWCWNLPTQEFAWESVLIPKLRSDDDGLQREADRHVRGCRSFSWLLLDDSEFWPKWKKRLQMMPERIFLMQSKITLTWKDGSLLDCALLVIRWWSCEMVTEAIVGIVFVLKKKIFSLNKSWIKTLSF